MRSVGILVAVEYHQAFGDLAGIYLEDSWVLDIASSDRDVSFRLEAVLTPQHPRYRPPEPGEQYCYLDGWLIVRSTEPIEVWLSRAGPAIDAAGEPDLGNIDRFAAGLDDVWEIVGDWGHARAVDPEVTVRFE